MLAAAGMLLLGTTISADAAHKPDGKKEFAEHCAVCHKDGGNIINAAKTLHKSDLDKNGIKTNADIINLMRNPGPGMTKFDSKTVTEREAKAIADYVLKTFK